MSGEDFVDILFDGPPGPESGRFVEVESPPGHGIRFGEWVDRGNGYWALRIPRPLTVTEAIKIDYETRAALGLNDKTPFSCMPARARELARDAERYRIARSALASLARVSEEAVDRNCDAEIAREPDR